MSRFYLYIVLCVCLAAVLVFPACDKGGDRIYDYSLPESERPLPQPPRAMLENSNVYTNEEYGFSLNYTDDFLVQENASGRVFVFVGPLIEEMTYAIHIFMLADEKDERFALADYAGIGKESAAYNLPDFTLLDEYVSTVAGQTAVVQVDSFTGTAQEQDFTLKEMIVHFVKDGTYYAMKYSSNAESFDEYIDTFYLALNTLTFTD